MEIGKEQLGVLLATSVQPEFPLGRWFELPHGAVCTPLQLGETAKTSGIVERTKIYPWLGVSI